jgi:hypothetical protein
VAVLAFVSCQLSVASCKERVSSGYWTTDKAVLALSLLDIADHFPTLAGAERPPGIDGNVIRDEGHVAVTVNDGCDRRFGQ